MDCHDFQTRLRRGAESRDSSVIEALRSHGESCESADCRRAWQDERLLQRAVAAWRRGSPPPSSQRVEAVLRELHPGTTFRPAAGVQRDKGRSLRSWTLAAAAAALLLTVSLLTPQPSPQSPLARTMSPLESRQLAAADRSPASYVGYAQEAAYFVTDLTMYVVPVSASDAEDGSGSSNWFKSLQEQIEPVRSDVSHKFGEWFGPAT